MPFQSLENKLVDISFAPNLLYEKRGRDTNEEDKLMTLMRL